MLLNTSLPRSLKSSIIISHIFPFVKALIVTKGVRIRRVPTPFAKFIHYIILCDYSFPLMISARSCLRRQTYVQIAVIRRMTILATRIVSPELLGWLA